MPTETSGETRTYPQLRYQRPPGATEVLLVRHGESAAADPARPFALVDGRGDPPLSPTGRAQAAALAERLGREEIDAIYVTSLQRTAQTAAPTALRLGLPVAVEPDLVEVHMGEWEGGLYRKFVSEGHPLAREVFTEERWDLIPGAESNDAIATRTGAAITRIVAAHAGARVVVVAHAVSISAVLARAARSSPFAFVGADNASISTIVVEPRRWQLRGFNDTAHLR